MEEYRDDGASFFEPFLQKLPEEAQKKARAALQEAEEREQRDGEIPITEEARKIVDEQLSKILPEGVLDAALADDSVLGDLETQLDLVPEEALLIRRFDQCLRRLVAKPASENYQKKAWQSYIRCKNGAPSFADLMPEEAWNILWRSLLDSQLEDKKRAERLSILSKDIMESGKMLSVSQSVKFVESLSQLGNLDEAVDAWEIQKNLQKRHGRSVSEFDMLGVRLFALQGNPRKAQQKALDVILSGRKDVSQVIAPVTQAWIRSGGESGTKHAWAMYLYLRNHLGDEISPDFYDKASMAFLNAGRTDLALAVFKDLMLIGTDSKYESVELYRACHGLVGKLQRQSVDAFDLTRVSLTALTTIPRNFQNKFFYASWMKRLIGKGEVDAAVMVVELMYERGVRPDAKHLNGIIGAWLRSGNAKNQEKAEQLGWSMIQERLEFVQKRQGEKNFTDPNSKAVSKPRTLLYLERGLVPATIETFSLLLLHYVRRGMLNHVQRLRELLPQAQIWPNTFFMNHLIYAELRRGEHEKSWKIYKSMSLTVRPDLETFAGLWDCQKAHQSKLTMYASDRFPSPRRLFCEMVSWYSQVKSKDRREARQAFNKDLYDQITRCMCLAKDLEGTLLSLYALKESFDFYPDEDTIRMLILQIASMGTGEQKAPGRRRTRLSGNTQHKAHIERIAKVLDLLTEERTERLNKKEVEVNEIGIKEEQLWVLSELLKTVMRRIHHTEKMEKRIDDAAWEMGVAGMRMGDPHLEEPNDEEVVVIMDKTTL